MMASADMLQGLWAAVLAVSAALLVLMMLPRILRRHFGAGVAYAAWWLLPVVLIASQLPGLHSDDSAPAISAAEPLFVPLRIVAQPVANTPAVASDHAVSWLMVWLAGATLMALWLGWQQRAFVRTLGQLRPLRDDMWKAEASHGLPALLGVIRTRIVLPVDFDQRFDDRERQLMLAHERWHRSRGDHFANLCVAIVRCLFWFNPLVHLAAARFRHDQELACDQAVVEAHPNSRRTYGEAMLKTLMADRQAPLGCHWGFSHPLKERVMQLVTPTPHPWARRIGAALVATLLSCAAFAVWSAQPARRVAPVAPVGAMSTVANANDDGVLFNHIVMKDGQEIARPSVWAPFGQSVAIEVDGAVRVVSRANPPRNNMSTVESTFYRRVDGEWVVDGLRSGDGGMMRMQANFDATPSFERTLTDDSHVRVVVMPRAAKAPPPPAPPIPPAPPAAPMAPKAPPADVSAGTVAPTRPAESPKAPQPPEAHKPMPIPQLDQARVVQTVRSQAIKAEAARAAAIEAQANIARNTGDAEAARADVARAIAAAKEAQEAARVAESVATLVDPVTADRVNARRAAMTPEERAVEVAALRERVARNRVKVRALSEVRALADKDQAPVPQAEPAADAGPAPDKIP